MRPNSTNGRTHRKLEIKIGISHSYPEATNNKTLQGDIVALHAVPGCAAEGCPECSRDLSQICERGHHSGIGQDGFYAAYATIDVRGAVLVPEGNVRVYTYSIQN